MKEKNIAKVWAHALLETAQDRKKLDASVGDVSLLRAVLGEVPDLGPFLASPKIAADKKKEVLGKALGRKIGPVMQDFLGLLVDRVRGMFLDDILEAFLEIYHEAIGVMDAHVRSAVPLAGTLEKQVQKRLEALFKKAVELHVEVDPTAIGGMTIQVGDTLFDGTLRRSLNEIAERLHRARIESEVIYADQD